MLYMTLVRAFVPSLLSLAFFIELMKSFWNEIEISHCAGMFFFNTNEEHARQLLLLGAARQLVALWRLLQSVAEFAHRVFSDLYST